MRDYYISRFDLNASHSYEDDKSRAHKHTFNIVVYVGRAQLENGDKVNLDIAEVEYRIEKFLESYADKYLNEVPEIRACGSDIEGLGKFFYNAIKQIVETINHELYQLDISDNKLNYFQLSDTINLPIISMEDGMNNYEIILRQQEYFDNNN